MEKNTGSNDGFVLIAAMLLLLVLTIVGAMATRSSVIELQIAGNERRSTEEFYIADSVWQYGGLWLEGEDNAPALVDPANASKYVQVYDGGIFKDPDDSDTAYGYKIAEFDHEKVSGEGANYRRFTYDIDAVAGNTSLSTRVTKVYKIGY